MALLRSEALERKVLKKHRNQVILCNYEIRFRFWRLEPVANVSGYKRVMDLAAGSKKEKYVVLC